MRVRLRHRPSPMAEAVGLIDQAVPQLELMRDLLAENRLLAMEGMEAELLRRTARAAFEDWFEARVRAQVMERKGHACQHPQVSHHPV